MVKLLFLGVDFILGNIYFILLYVIFIWILIFVGIFFNVWGIIIGFVLLDIIGVYVFIKGVLIL